MDDIQKKFIHLAVVEQLKYADIEKELDIPVKEFSPWWDEFKEYREDLSNIRKIFRSKEGVNFTKDNFWRFYEWFKSKGKQCHYCGITEQQIDELFKQGSVNTKRQKTRGKKLEIERVKPNEPYSNTDNLVSCCYWCNNAKTDEFSADEFKPIGKAIGEVWKKRLRNN